ncbi:MAG: VWA domain-containing protein [Pseudomonadota bacterium]
MRSSCAAGLACAFAVGLSVSPAGAEDKAIIVLDGSGSMWGQIEGTPKITIARDVLSGVLGTTPDTLSLGLMSYGHRRRGDCSDIEMLVPMGADTAGPIAQAARDISPRGKTPLSDAVKQAAETLKYEEDKATVILITDGIETCRADPCALARDLERTGIDFTVHVVGFGLSSKEGKQVACIAEETGGLYMKADDAASLGEALADSVEQAAAAPPPPAPEPEGTEPAPLPSAAIMAPDSVEIGRRIAVSWDGPGEQYDDIYFFDPTGNNGDGRRLQGRRLYGGDYDNKRLTLVAPARPGSYELHYYYGVGRAVIANRPIEVVEAEVSLDAPATVEIGRRFEVSWVGPGGTRDAVEIIDPAADQGAGKALRAVRLANGDMDGRTVEMVAPAEPGFYRLHYWNGDNRVVLATREIEVLEAEVSLQAPDAVSISAPIKVDWIGPGGRRDSVQVVDPQAKQGQGRAVVEKRLSNGDLDNQTLTLIAPARPGSYELRYWNGENRKVLATRPIVIEDAEVSIEAPESVRIAHLVEVAWIGPGAQRDAIELFDPNAQAGRGKVLKSVRLTNGDMDARTVRLGVVAKPGTYQLRYWNGINRTVLATRPIEVVAMDVTVEGPQSVGAEQEFSVTWDGPGARRDAIEIFDPDHGAGKGRVVVARRLVNGDYDNRTVRLKAPERSGTYQIRYWNGDNRTVLATQELMVD